jgi:hypothetical protein
VVIANIAYILTVAESESYAVRKIKGLRKLVGVLPVGEPEVDRAADRPGADFEDSLHYHCATAAGVRFIVTRNRDDFLTDGVQILDPA